MELTQLRAFVAVAEAQSFTRGAEAVGWPQPVVSRRVAALERDLGARLLHRTSRSVELTTFGATLLPYASDLVSRADHVERLARTHADVPVVALPPGADPRGLVAARRVAQRVGLTLGFVEHPAEVRAELIAAGRIAAALLPSPADRGVIEAELGAGTRSDRPRGRRVHLDQLRRSDPDSRPVLLHLDAEDDVAWVRDPIRRAARLGGLRPDQVRVAATATEALTAVLDHGDVAVCTRTWAAAHELHWRPLGVPELRRSYRVAQPSAAPPLAGLEQVLPSLGRALGLES